MFRYSIGENGRRITRETGWQRRPPQCQVPLLAGSWCLNTIFFTKTWPWFSHREIYQRQWEGLNVKYSGLFSKIMVAVLLTCIQANWLSVSRSLRVTLGSTRKTSGYLASPCLFYLFFFLFCLFNSQAKSENLGLIAAPVSLLIDPRAILWCKHRLLGGYSSIFPRKLM